MALITGTITETVRRIKEQLAAAQKPPPPPPKPLDWGGSAGVGLSPEPFRSPAASLMSQAPVRAYEAELARTHTRQSEDVIPKLRQINEAGAQYTRPVMQPIRNAVGDVIRASAPVVEQLPVIGQVQQVGKVTPRFPTPTGVGAGVAEGMVPVEPWEIALELVPGIGSMPGGVSALRGSMPALRLAARSAKMSVEEYVATKQGREALEALLKKRGIAPIAGGADDASKIPGTPDLPEPAAGRDVTPEGYGPTGAGELPDPQRVFASRQPSEREQQLRSSIQEGETVIRGQRADKAAATRRLIDRQKAELAELLRADEGYRAAVSATDYEPKPGAEGAAGGMPASAAGAPPPPKPPVAAAASGDLPSGPRRPPLYARPEEPLPSDFFEPAGKPEVNLTPEPPDRALPAGQAAEPASQPPLGLIDDQGQIINPLDPTVSLARRAFGGEAPTLPPDVSVPAVDEWRRTWNEFAEQAKTADDAYTAAVARRKAVAQLYDSPQQVSIRRAQKEAAKQGLAGDTSNALPPTVKTEAAARVREARQAKDAAREAMAQAHIRVVDDDLVRRLEGSDVSPRVLDDVRAQLRLSQLEQQGEADFLTMPGWRRRLEHVYNRFGGNLSGPVGASARRAASLNNGLNVWAHDFSVNYLKPMQQLLDKNGDKLKFVGSPENAELAETHRLRYIFTNPEDFRGITPEMWKLMNKAEQEAGAFYQGTRQFDPLHTAKPVDGRYLPQLWVDGIDHVEQFAHARGKAFLTKERMWKDWRVAIKSGQWSKDLAEMTPGEALEYATRATAQQMSDFYMRRDILRRFGSRVQKEGMTPFNAPIYKGWYGDPEIVSQVDAFFEPARSLDPFGLIPTKTAAKVLQPIKNMRYGIDFAIAGLNVVHSLASGNVQLTVGAMEEILRKVGVKTIGEYADEAVLIQHGLPSRGAESMFQARGGTPLSWIPLLRRIDPKVTGGLNWVQHQQYSNIMGPLRHLMVNGNLALERATGTLTPAKIRRAIDNGSALTLTSRGAQRTGRAETESVLLGSSRISRAQFATLGQLAKINTPETIATLASYGITIGLVGMAIDRTWGDGTGYTFSPFSVKDGKLEYNSEWATVAVKGRRYPLIPSASLARAIAKSMAAASQMDPDKFARAWAQYGFTRTTPGIQGPVTAGTGAGFGPRGFQPWNGVTGLQRGLATLPIPVAGTTQLDSDQRGIRPGIESLFGVSSYPSTNSTTANKRTPFQRTPIRRPLSRK